MSYNDRFSPAVGIGCLPAALFGAVVGSAIFIPHQRLPLLPFALGLGALCALITWATNTIVHKLAETGRGPAWGLILGFSLAGALVATLVALLIVVTR